MRSAPLSVDDRAAEFSFMSRAAGGGAQDAPNQSDLVLVGLVEVEPAGANDGVRESAGADQSLPAALPVMTGCVLRDPDRRHQRDTRAGAAEGIQHVPHGSVVDRFRFRGAAVGSVGEDDAIDSYDGFGERARIGEITRHDLGLVRQCGSRLAFVRGRGFGSRVSALRPPRAGRRCRSGQRRALCHQA